MPKLRNTARVVHSTLTLRATIIEAARAYRAAYDGDDDAEYQRCEERLLDAIDRLEAAESVPAGLETKLRRVRVVSRKALAGV